MANKAEIFQKLESLLPEGVVLNPDDYSKKELEAMINLGAQGEAFDHLFKRKEDSEEEEPGRPGGRSIQIEDPSLLEKIGATEPVSRQEYIRQRFEQDVHRREIASELGVVYQIVFAATKNLFNTHHTPGKRGGRSTSILVTDPETGEETQMTRTDYIKQQYELGRGRTDIAQELEISYGLVYAATKNIIRDEEVVAAYKREHMQEEDVPAADDEDDTVDVEELESFEEETDEAFPG